MSRFVLKYQHAAMGPLAQVKRDMVVVEAKSSTEAIETLAASLKAKAVQLVMVDSVKELKL